MNSGHRKTLEAIRTVPTLSTVRWADIEALLTSCGAEISKGGGSRIRVVLNGIKASFHRPHPSPHAVKGAVESVRDLLEEAGI